MSTDKRQKTANSKLLSLVLRHEPERAGLTLDPGGWVAVDDLLAGLTAHDTPLTRDALDKIVAENDKKRFTLSSDGRRIRAAQGHSVPVDLNLSPKTPPVTLFHGTAVGNVEAILTEGITPRSRQHVHLSTDTETATRVGQRHGKPVVLEIASGTMHADGCLFWQADNGVWLTDYVAPKYLTR